MESQYYAIHEGSHRLNIVSEVELECPLYKKYESLSNCDVYLKKSSSQDKIELITKSKKYHVKSTLLDGYLKNILKHKSKIEKKDKGALNLQKVLSRISKDINLSAINIFLHHKGFSYAQLVRFSKEEFKLEKVLVNEFNKLFLSIKKSKNNNLGESVQKAETEHIIGTYIPLIDSHNDINLIVCFGNNDFLPIAISDQEIQSIFTKHQSILISTLKSSHFFDQNKAIKDITSKVLLRRHIKDSHRDNLWEYYHKKKIKVLGSLLNNLKHELSNPLFGLSLAIVDFQDHSDFDLKDFHADISFGLERCNLLINSFEKYFNEKQKINNTNVSQLISEVSLLCKSELRFINVTIEIEEELEIKTNKSILAQAVLNLLINASHALKDNDTKKITIKAITAPDKILLSISDNGPGINSDMQNLIFNQFYTTKEFGTGLGLFISQKLLLQINSQLYYNSLYTQGAQFVIALPNESSDR